MSKMKLYYAPPSPYSRKVRVFMAEKNLEDQVDVEIFSPYGEDISSLTKVNPLGKIPVLILPDGSNIYDSSVICEFLNIYNPENDLIGKSEERIINLRQNALGNGIMDVAFNIVSERRRDTENSAHWISRWLNAIERGLKSVEEDIAKFDTSDVSLGKISIATAVGYVDFRIKDKEWRVINPKVFQWVDEFEKRKSMKETMYGEFPK